MIVIQPVGLSQEVEDDRCLPTSTLSNNKSSNVSRGLFSRLLLLLLPGCQAYCLLILIADQHRLVVSTNWMHCCNLSTWHSVFSPLEHSFDTVDFLHTRLQLLLIEDSLNRLSTGILYSICWWFSSFHCCNGKHLCPIGCKAVFKCTFLPHYTHLIPQRGLGWCSFSSIDFGVECIMYVLIYILRACVHLWALAWSIEDMYYYTSLPVERLYILLCVIRCKVLPHYILHRPIPSFYNAWLLLVLHRIECNIISSTLFTCWL